MLKKVISAYLLFYFSPISLADDAYLCTSKKSVGFNVERKFNITKFSSRKWIIKKINSHSWNVFEEGNNHAQMYCDDSNPEVFDKIRCGGLHGNLIMSKTNLRYVSSTYGQYVDDKINTGNISIEFGDCSGL